MRDHQSRDAVPANEARGLVCLVRKHGRRPGYHAPEAALKSQALGATLRSPSLAAAKRGSQEARGAPSWRTLCRARSAENIAAIELRGRRAGVRAPHARPSACGAIQHDRLGKGPRWGAAPRVNHLPMPLGPRVDLTRSAIARAPTKEAMRAFSPLSTWAFSESTLCSVVCV